MPAAIYLYDVGGNFLKINNVYGLKYLNPHT